MLVIHVVIFFWKGDVAPAQLKALARALDALPETISDIIRFQHGPDLGFRDSNGDYCLVASFADRAGWDAYQAHPAHKAVLIKHIEPMTARRVAVQF